MQIDAISLFCDVAEHRSISKAAELNGITQSAVSQRIMALEKELEVQLIDRSKRPLQLTAAGERYWQGCRQILEQYDQLKRDLADASGAMRGEIRVASIYSAGIDLLNEVAERFEADHPRVAVELKYYQPDRVYDMVRSEHVDLGILSYPKVWRGLAWQVLRDEEMVVVCRVGHPWAARFVSEQSVDASELSDQEMVLFDQRLPIHRHLTGYLREQGVRPVVAHTFDNIDTIKAYLVHADEVAILPRRTVLREVSAGQLVALGLRPGLTRPLAVVYPRQRSLSPLVQSFIDRLCIHKPTPQPNAVSALSAAVAS